MPKQNLVKEVADYCWSRNFLDVFRNYFAEHGPLFEDAPPMHNGEHDLRYYSLFQKYLTLYEDSLLDYLKTLDVSMEDFYREVRNTQAETSDPYLLTFIDCLVASCDYDSFYKVMIKEGFKSKAKRGLGLSADAKAESKTLECPFKSTSSTSATYPSESKGEASQAKGEGKSTDSK